MMPSRHTQVLALFAMGIALLFAVRFHETRGNEIAAPAWTHEVEAGRDHVSVREFADRCLERPDSFALVDVRPLEEYESFHLPGATRMDLPTLLGPTGKAWLDASRDRLVVLYSNGMVHPAQAWVELRRRGHENVRVLEDGLTGFLERELTPPSLRGATTRQRAEEERLRYRALESWMKGTATERYATDPERLELPTVVFTAWLREHRGEVLVLDARSRAEGFEEGHLPGALHVPVEAVRGTVNGVDDELLESQALAARFGELGIDRETPVVVLAEEKLGDATQVLLALFAVGHRRLAILEGGLAAWRAEGLPLTVESTTPEPRSYEPRAPLEPFAATLQDVEEAMRAGAPKILDVRPLDEFRGDHVREARPGHIPGSLHRFQGDDHVATGEGDFWRPRAILEHAYATLGLTSETPVIVTCRTGHQASLTWFTLRWLLGHEAVRVYDGSWKEWSRVPRLPAEVGS